jgi:23S rRNA (uracil1939-C5)-methyltransferase
VSTSVTITAESLEESGRGIGRAGELEVRATDLLPGESATVEIEHRSRHKPVAWGHVVERDEESEHRRLPACPGFGRCGGCAWQHLGYDQQLVWKRRLVAEALGRADVLPVVPAPAELGYRNKGKYVVGVVNGRVALGAYAPRSHELVDTVDCRVVSPDIAALASRCRDAIEESQLSPYDERARTGHARYVVLRQGCDGRCLAVLVTTSDAPRAKVIAAAERLGGDVVWMRNDTTTGAITTDDHEVLSGRGYVAESVGDASVEVGPTAFFQVNRAQAARMYRDIAAAAVRSSTRIADLYSGVGGIAFTLAAAGCDVVGIERDPDAVDAAQRAVTRVISGGPISLRPRSCRFVSGDAARLSELADIDLVVVNPPRSGLGPDAMAAVVDAKPERIIYVSCGPRSLARDLSVLEGDGYRVEGVQPYDFMPGTGQVETVVFLHR